MPVRAYEASGHLRTPEDVAAYFNAAIGESAGDPRLLIEVFRNVAAAQGWAPPSLGGRMSAVWPPLPRPVGNSGPPVGDGEEGCRGVGRGAAVRSTGRRRLNVEGEARFG